MDTTISSPDFEAVPVTLTEILPFRDLYRQEMNAEIVHDSLHGRGFTAPYLLRNRGRVAGYGCVGDYDTQRREIVSEFYVTPDHRADAVPLFDALRVASDASRVRAQTNDRLLTLLLYDFCRPDSITTETILFEDAATTCLPPPPGVSFRPLRDDEKAGVFTHHREPVGDWAVEVGGEVVGTGGFYCHYNPPYADIFMEVAEAHRRRGIGSYLVQEIKRVCYEEGKRPASRCHVSNVASRRAQEQSGLLPCARILEGVIGPVSPG